MKFKVTTRPDNGAEVNRGDCLFSLVTSCIEGNGASKHHVNLFENRG